jgi:RNA polymerase sigma factor (TIGR02999 family)
MTRRPDTIELLDRGRRGDCAAQTALIERFYQAFRQIAHWQMRRVHQESVQPTDFVNEVLGKLIESGTHLKAADRQHLLAIFGTALRRRYVTRIRRRHAIKRFGKMERVVFDPDLLAAPSSALDPVVVLQLEPHLARLKGEHPDWALIVELRFYGDLSWPQIANGLRIAESTAKLRFARAKSWLFEAMTNGSADSRV